MMHADGTKYGWWKDPPTTLGHKNNYVMTLPELIVYEAALKALHSTVQDEWDGVRNTRRAIETNLVHQFNPSPQPITLASVLQFCVAAGKHRLVIMQCLNHLIERNSNVAK